MFENKVKYSNTIDADDVLKLKEIYYSYDGYAYVDGYLISPATTRRKRHIIRRRSIFFIFTFRTARLMLCRRDILKYQKLLKQWMR